MTEKERRKNKGKYRGAITLIEARLLQYRRQHEKEVELALDYKSQYEEVVRHIEDLEKQGAPEEALENARSLAEEKAQKNREHYEKARDLENRILVNEELLKNEREKEGEGDGE